MKRFSRLLLVVVLLVSLLVPVAAFAAEAENVSGESDFVPSSSNAGGTVTDRHGNRYYVFGISNRLGENASVRTEYEVTYYYGGTEEDVARVNGYTKTLTARGDVSLAGGGANNFGDTKRERNLFCVNG